MPVEFIYWYESFVMKEDYRINSLIKQLDNINIELLSLKKIRKIFENARQNVPAYRDFLKNNDVKLKTINSLDEFNSMIPETNKQNYINTYDIEQRCIGGRFPKSGNIDESAGSTGNPTNWVHSVTEEKMMQKLFRYEFSYDFEGNKIHYIILNLWSTGAWATGIKFSEVMQHHALIKNIGTDIPKALDTLKQFGTGYEYLLAGYPPFLRLLIDEGENKLDWKRYKITVLTGGEGFIPEWRDYMYKKIGKNRAIISAYGSSDVDIGIAFETFFSSYIRQIIRKNRKLRKALFGSEDKIPMIFQYDPLQYYINQVKRTRSDRTEVSEFEITALDINIANPKIKYNIHDEGGVFTYDEMINIIRQERPSFLKNFRHDEKHNKKILKLPFLWVNGRSDGTVSLDGANVYPHNIDVAIHSDKELIKKTSSFKLSVAENKKGAFRFNIHIELKDGYKPNKNTQKRYHNLIIKKLLEINRDYKESYLRDKKSLEPIITLYRFGSGPFRIKNKIKNIYIH